MGKRKSASIPCHSHKRAGQPSRTPPTSDTVRHSPPGKALPHVRADCPCSRQLCASSTGLSLEAVEFNIASADDCVYCVVCLKKEGEDFLLCDACDGGMHRQCALLDQVPAGFWACLNCQQHPTLDSAIRQVLHEHSESGLLKDQLFKKLRRRVPTAGSAELSQALEQALNHVDVTFDHEYKVVMLRNRYHLVKTAAPDDSNDQQLLPDSDDELPSMQLRGTSGSEEDAPNTRRRIMRRRSPSSQRFCLADPIAMEGSSQEDTGWNTAHPAVADSFTAFTARSSHSQEGSKHSYQKCGSAHHAGMSPPGLLKASKWESVAVGQDKGSGVEQSSVVKPASANTSSHSISSADSASVAPKLMVQTELEQQQSSHTTEPQGCHMQTCMHSTRLHQQQQQPQQQQEAQQQHIQQQQPQQQQTQTQQRQGSSLDVSHNLGNAHSRVCSALAGLARFHAYSAAKQIALVAAYTQYVQMQRQSGPSGMAGDAEDSGGHSPSVCKDAPDVADSADQQLDTHGVESPGAHSDEELKLQWATSPETQALSAPLSSAEDPNPGVTHFLSIMSQHNVQTMPVQQRHNQVFKAVSQLAELSRFEHLLDTLDATHAGELLQNVGSRMHTLAASKALEPVMVGVFLQTYWQQLVA